MIVDKILKKSERRVHLSIIDSTRTPHNRTNDSRNCSSSSGHGIGSSELYIAMDVEGKPTHISWSLLGKKLTKEIEIGRIRSSTARL